MTRTALVFLFSVVLAAPALAHPGGGEQGLASGFVHAMTGADHLFAMVTVGIWAAFQRRGARFAWPALFVVTLLAGAAMAFANIALPLVEPTILASVVVFGLAVALLVRVSTPVGAAIIFPFALVHGHAHGTYIGGADPVIFFVGLAAATSLLIVAGMGMARLAERAHLSMWLRAAAGIGAVGMAALGAGL